MTSLQIFLKQLKKNEFQLKIIPKAKPQAPDGLIGKYYQTFEEKMSVLHKHFHMIEENTFQFTYEANSANTPNTKIRLRKQYEKPAQCLS